MYRHILTKKNPLDIVIEWLKALLFSDERTDGYFIHVESRPTQKRIGCDVTFPNGLLQELIGLRKHSDDLLTSYGELVKQKLKFLL